MDTILIESNGFIKEGYQISMINRIGRKGGWLALMYRSNITVTKVDQNLTQILLISALENSHRKLHPKHTFPSPPTIFSMAENKPTPCYISNMISHSSGLA